MVPGAVTVIASRDTCPYAVTRFRTDQLPETLLAILQIGCAPSKRVNC
ncbi:unnamed protein product [Haemonchus placei]|uniref:Transposase n=1 Tax=Haemonchus placei TaxID=6290 RepID=A0A0N4W130_HAEPC|nr:unnamed protein product [Haemonchus placei]